MDQKKFNYIVEGFVDDAEVKQSIRHIDIVDTAYSMSLEVEGAKNTSNDHLYSASTNEIDEKKPELKDLPSHLEYAYLYNDTSFLIIILSKLSGTKKRLLLQVLEKRKRAIAWKMRLNPKVQDVVKNEIVKLLDSRLIYPISDSPWVSHIHVVPKKGGMTVDFFSRFQLRLKIKKRRRSPVHMEHLPIEEFCLDYETHQQPFSNA
ncbi:hypothetical protein Tco_0223331 [Tanacetum coccineum]